MTLAWPAGVVGNVQTEVPMALGNPQKSPLTGTTQGGGSSVVMWRLELSFPPQNSLTNVRAIRTVMAQAKQDTVAIPVRQPGFTVGSPGTVTVGTGHVAGTKTLQLAGIAGGYAFVAGQFISILTGGRYYLYTLAADSAAGSATRTVTLTSTTRAAHASGNTVDVAAPMIEGWVDLKSLSADVNSHYGFSVAIEEAQ
jgi:hypothetical protein